MLLTKHLGELLQQLHEREGPARDESAAGLIAEIEALGVLIERMETGPFFYEGRALRDFYGPELIPYSLGPRPTHCRACGQELP